MSRADRPRRPPTQARIREGQALLELALVLPFLLFLTFAVVGAGRVVQARQGVSAVAREAARAGTAGLSPAAGRGRGEEVARGYGLTNGSLEVRVDGGRFAPGGRVVAYAAYEVRFDDLPLPGWARLRVRGEAWEAIDLYRSVK